MKKNKIIIFFVIGFLFGFVFGFQLRSRKLISPLAENKIQLNNNEYERYKNINNQNQRG